MNDCGSRQINEPICSSPPFSYTMSVLLCFWGPVGSHAAAAAVAQLTSARLEVIEADMLLAPGTFPCKAEEKVK